MKGKQFRHVIINSDIVSLYTDDDIWKSVLFSDSLVTTSQTGKVNHQLVAKCCYYGKLFVPGDFDCGVQRRKFPL